MLSLSLSLLSNLFFSLYLTPLSLSPSLSLSLFITLFFSFPLTFFIPYLSVSTHSFLSVCSGAGGHGGSAQWSNLKSAIILCLSVTAISLCSDLIAGNIAPLLNVGGISEVGRNVKVSSSKLWKGLLSNQYSCNFVTPQLCYE